jgi:hypothetical protein
MSQSVTASSSRQRHWDRDLATCKRTELTVQGNGVQVPRVAVQSLSERTHRYGSATEAIECRSGHEEEHMARERRRSLMLVRKLVPSLHPWAETLFATGNEAERAASQAEGVCEGQ